MYKQCHNSKFYNLWLWKPREIIAVLFKYFEFQKYFPLEIEEEWDLLLMVRSISEKWCLVSLKRIFVVGFAVSCLVLLGNEIFQKKADLFLWQKNLCLFNKTIQQYEMELRHLGKYYFSSAIFFPIWLAVKKKSSKW